MGIIEGGINICSCMSNLSLEGYTGNSHDDLGGQRVGHDGSDLACMYAWTKTIAVSEETVLILSDW